MMRGSGSVALVAAPRAAYLIVRDVEQADRRLFLPLKNNLAKIRTGLAFKVIDKMAPEPVSENYPALEWEAQPVAMTADEALGQKPDGRERETLNEAKALLTELLGDGPMPKTGIDARAGERGIKDKSLRNAQAQLHIKSRKSNGRWWWAFSGDENQIPGCEDEPNVF